MTEEKETNNVYYRILPDSLERQALF